MSRKYNPRPKTSLGAVKTWPLSTGHRLAVVQCRGCQPLTRGPHPCCNGGLRAQVSEISADRTRLFAFISSSRTRQLGICGIHVGKDLSWAFSIFTIVPRDIARTHQALYQRERLSDITNSGDVA